jgi:hypothetical protein
MNEWRHNQVPCWGPSSARGSAPASGIALGKLWFPVPAVPGQDDNSGLSFSELIAQDLSLHKTKDTRNLATPGKLCSEKLKERS